MSAPPLLQLSDVGREIAGRCVVKGLNLTLVRGGVLGLLGVNGAGKTTTLRMIAGLLNPGTGRILIDGGDLRDDPQRVRTKLGYLPEQVPAYDELRVSEYLDFCARLHGMRGAALAQAVAAAVQRCGLGDVSRRLLGVLSRGYRQRVGIAQAIVHDPALIVLDEPASGLDPLQSSGIRRLIGELGRDHAVILSTHLLADVQACCARVAILQQGRLRHDGPLHADESTLRMRVRTAMSVTAQQWLGLAGVGDAKPAEDGWSIALADDSDPAQLARAVVGAGWGLMELRREVPGLEEIFMRITTSTDAERAPA